MTTQQELKRKRRRQFPPLRTSISSGPFPGDGERFFIGTNLELCMPSYLACCGSHIDMRYDGNGNDNDKSFLTVETTPNLMASPSTANAAAATGTAPGAPLTVNWFDKASIDRHHPMNKRFGHRMPPINWRGSDARMRTWRKLSNSQQEDEWARWNALTQTEKNEMTHFLERIQMGHPPQGIKAVLALSAEVQTDESLLDMRDEPDAVIIERLTKRAKVEGANVPVDLEAATRLPFTATRTAAVAAIGRGKVPVQTLSLPKPMSSLKNEPHSLHRPPTPRPTCISLTEKQ